MGREIYDNTMSFQGLARRFRRGRKESASSFLDSITDDQIDEIMEKRVLMQDADTTGMFTHVDDEDDERTGSWKDEITPQLIDKIIKRHPAADSITYGAGSDATIDKFEIVDSNNEQNDLLVAGINRRFQKEARRTQFWPELAVGVGHAMAYGHCLMLARHDDVDEPADLANPLARGARIIRWEAFRPTVIEPFRWDKFGVPTVWLVQHPAEYGTETLVYVHASRCYVLNVWKRKNSYKGRSLVENAFAMTQALFEVSRGSGEAFNRWGTGQPLIKVAKGIDGKKFKKLRDAARWITRRSHNTINTQYIEDIEYKGNTGVALDPKKFVEAIVLLLAITIRHPKAVLEGSQAGRLAGSEFNDRRYMAYIDEIQRNVEDRFINDVLMDWFPELDSDDIDWKIKWPIKLVTTPADDEKLKDLKLTRILKLAQLIGREFALREYGFSQEMIEQIMQEPPMIGGGGSEENGEEENEMEQQPFEAGPNNNQERRVKLDVRNDRNGKNK